MITRLFFGPETEIESREIVEDWDEQDESCDDLESLLEELVGRDEK